MVPLTLLSCSPKVNIEKILNNPREYDGKMVVIEGRVVESANLLLLKYFVLDDETGQIVVVTEKAVPKQGQYVKVKGVVNQAFQIQDKSLIVIIEK